MTVHALDTVLTDFQSARLQPMVPQEVSLALLTKAMTKAIAVREGKESDQQVEKIFRRLKVLFSQFAASPDKIKERYMAIWPQHDDFQALVKANICENNRFVPHDPVFPMFNELAQHHRQPEGASLGVRMELYRQECERHLSVLYDNVVSPPDQMIHVTSTGYCDPNPVQLLISERGWHDTIVHNSYNKACNGAIPAIRLADALMQQSYGGAGRTDSRVDIIHSEMFSLHINLTHNHPVNISLVNSYSDSFLRYSLCSHETVRTKGMRGLKIIGIKDYTIPGSSSVCRWMVSDPSFEFTIDVLQHFRLIRKHVRQLVDRLFAGVGMEFDDVRDSLVYGLQMSSSLPMKEIKKGLSLSDDQVALSKKLLYEQGYLSSAALPFMCKQILESDDVPVGQKVLCIGYAQGVTMSAMLLEKV